MTKSEFLAGLGREVTWPDAPTLYSFSTLRAIERCPRQWALLNADYPEIWAGRGYPDRPAQAALQGSCLHLAMEALLRHARSVESESPVDRLALAVRAAGGFPQLINDAIGVLHKRLIGNPRISTRLPFLMDQLSAQLPLLRQRLQAMSSVLRGLELRDEPGEGERGGAHRLPLGAYPEIWLSSSSLRLRGQLDLLVLGGSDVEIVDYKSGTPSDEHRRQVELYAALWVEDEKHNPDARPATKLRLVYSGTQVEWEGPHGPALSQLTADLRSRVTKADAELGTTPRAVPTSENCRYCTVRQLCDPFWAEAPALPSTQVNVELEVGERLSARTWAVSVLRAVPPGVRAEVLRVPDDRVDFRSGTKLRVVDAYVGEGEQGAYIGVGEWSEIFITA